MLIHLTAATLSLINCLSKRREFICIIRLIFDPFIVLNLAVVHLINRLVKIGEMKTNIITCLKIKSITEFLGMIDQNIKWGFAQLVLFHFLS